MNMETPEQSSKAHLAEFQAEIAELKRREETRESPTSHFPSVDVAELTEEDMAMYKMCMSCLASKSMSSEDEESFRKYVKSAQARGGVRSRSAFAAFLNNKIAPIIILRSLQTPVDF